MPTTRNRRKTQRFGDLLRKGLEVMNPRVTCGSSREGDDKHAPVGINDPFTSSFVEKRLDTEFGK